LGVPGFSQNCHQNCHQISLSRTSVHQTAGSHQQLHISHAEECMSDCRLSLEEQESIVRCNAGIPDIMTPGKAIHRACVDCVGSPFAVKDCQGERLHDGPCLFFRYRLGKGRPSVKLIRKYCLWCMGGSPKLVKDCHSGLTCPLFAYRLGRNPKMRHLTRRFFTRNARLESHRTGDGWHICLLKGVGLKFLFARSLM